MFYDFYITGSVVKPASSIEITDNSVELESSFSIDWPKGRQKVRSLSQGRLCQSTPAASEIPHRSVLARYQDKNLNNNGLINNNNSSLDKSFTVSGHGDNDSSVANPIPSRKPRSLTLDPPSTILSPSTFSNNSFSPLLQPSLTTASPPIVDYNSLVHDSDLGFPLKDIILLGQVLTGVLSLEDKLLLGPFGVDGAFHEVLIRIYILY